MNGLDEELGQEEKVLPMREEKQPKRKPFHYWTVDGVEHKLKLSTSMVTKLENKYKTNVMNLIISDGMPPLSVMLTVVQAAINPWEHGTSYGDVEKMFDTWLEKDGGDQQSFYQNVIIPLMAVSGFFTEKQAAEIMESLKENGSQI